MRDGEFVAVLETILKRRDLLNLLAGESLDKASIVRQLDVSRSTVNRALSTLGEQGLVERVEGRYRATQVGSLANEQFDRTLATLAGIVESRPLLEHANGFEPPVEAFRNVAVVTNEEGTLGPVRRLTDLFVEATRVHSVGGLFRRTVPRAVQDHTAAEDFEFSMAISTETFDYAEAYFDEELRRTVDADRHEVRLLDEQPPVTVALFSPDEDSEETETAVVVFYDDQMEPVGFLESTDRRCREWAWSQFENAWATSTSASAYLDRGHE